MPLTGLSRHALYHMSIPSFMLQAATFKKKNYLAQAI